MDERKIQFIMESNAIEDIDRMPLDTEIAAHEAFWELDELTIPDVTGFVMKIIPTFKIDPLRQRPGMDVRIGNYFPQPGSPRVGADLNNLLHMANGGKVHPYIVHAEYEKLHPYMDGNGRSGRAIWAWMMMNQGADPFRMSFLRWWYYMSLDQYRS